MKRTYCALVYASDKEKGFTAQFPDIPGCITEGDTIEEVKQMAEDALGQMVAIKQECKETLPEPTTDYKKLLAMADSDIGHVAFVIPVTVYTEAPYIRISMSGPEDKLEMIKEFAASCGTTRSAFMVDASMEKIARMKKGE
ncbi:MAG: type II toxin-antitoxin system HicB family antitoxin [Victivallales bacterium]|nr:type II toxin-antitoxin system HicB family antitoxin [Victivallales bacterium]